MTDADFEVQKDTAYESNGNTNFESRMADVTAAVKVIQNSTAAARSSNLDRAIARSSGYRGAVLARYLKVWSRLEEGHGKNFFQIWGGLLKVAPSTMEAIEAVNCEIWERMTVTTQGRSSNRRVRNTDLGRALAKLRLPSYKMVRLDPTRSEMELYGMTWNAAGLLEPCRENMWEPMQRPTFTDELEFATIAPRLMAVDTAHESSRSPVRDTSKDTSGDTPVDTPQTARRKNTAKRGGSSARGRDHKRSKRSHAVA
jgi:hypothetical protein